VCEEARTLHTLYGCHMVLHKECPQFFFVVEKGTSVRVNNDFSKEPEGPASYFTPAQAAAVTGLPLAAIHKAIDSRLISPRSARSGTTGRRLLTKEQLIYLQLEAEGLRLLPIGTRREIAESMQRSPKAV
jgi:hypothetical protein